MSLKPALYSKLPYDPVEGFSIVSVVYRGPVLVLVDPSSPSARRSDCPAWRRSTEGWSSLVTPAGVPAPILQRLSQETRKIMTQLRRAGNLRRLRCLRRGDDARGIAAYVTAETARWGEVIRAAGIRLD